MIKKGFIDHKENDGLEVFSKGFLGAVAGFGATIGIRMAAVYAIETLGIAAGIAVVPVVGWIVSGAIGLITLGAMISDYIGIWIRANCFDDIISILYNTIIQNKSNMLCTYCDNYKEVASKFINSFKTFSIDTEPNLELKKILAKFEVSEVKIDSMSNQNALNIELEKLALNSSEDMDKVIDFFKKNSY